MATENPPDVAEPPRAGTVVENGRIGILNQDQLTRLTALFQAKFGDRQCEMCGSPDWALNESLASPMLISMEANGAFNLNFSRGSPSVMLHCRNCGNTKLFNLLQLGFQLHE